MLWTPYDIYIQQNMFIKAELQNQGYTEELIKLIYNSYIRRTSAYVHLFDEKKLLKIASPQGNNPTLIKYLVAGFKLIYNRLFQGLVWRCKDQPPVDGGKDAMYNRL